MSHPALEAARRVLAAAVDGLESGGRAVPARVFVAVGSLPAWDAEQLCVAVTRPVVPGQPGRDVTRGHQHRLPSFIELRVELTRCTPVGTAKAPPTAQQLTDSGEALLLDADALSDGLQPEALREPDRNVPVYVSPIALTIPEGGLVGVFVTVQVPR